LGRIAERFHKLKEQGRKALVVYVMGGDPSLAVTEAIIPFLVEQGVDLVEIGVPFSDPLADGPTIQEAGQRALKTSLGDLLALVQRLRPQLDAGLLLMSYYNPILNRTSARFAREAQACGLDGLIIPDLIPEEGEELIGRCRALGIDYVPLLAPTTSDARLQYLVGQGSGFLYYVSRTGTTGVREDVAGDLQDNLQRIRAHTSLPIVVGFGISRAEQATMVTRHADGVVIGSAVVKRMAEANGDLDKMKSSLVEFLSPLVAVLHER
jgi:tryptophan synthase alpha chain